MSYRDDEHIVCEFLREISPSREWRYLDEVEHYWIDELCESIREHERAENAKLRELCKKLYRLADESYVPFKDVNPWMNEFDNAIRAMRELGIEVDE